MDREVGNFSHDFVEGPALFASPPVGDDAVGAELVTAMDNRDVRGRALRNGVCARPELPAQVLVGGFDEPQDAIELLWPSEHVDLGEALFKIVGLEPHHATHECYLEGRLVSLQSPHAAE